MNSVKHVVFAFALLAAVLSGCASYPISKNLRQQAKEVTFNEVRANPEGTRGTIVVWGGRIINVVNEPVGSSIYIVCLPVGDDEKPVPGAPSPGRFIATSPGYLDPEMFPQRSRITVAGQLEGIRTEQLGKIQYPYPVIDVQETHVWPMDQEEYPYYGYDYGPYWGWDWGWGPSWWWYGGYPYYYGGYYRGYHGGFHGGGGGAGFRGAGGFGGGHGGGGGGGGGGHR